MHLGKLVWANHAPFMNLPRSFRTMHTFLIPHIHFKQANPVKSFPKGDESHTKIADVKNENDTNVIAEKSKVSHVNKLNINLSPI